VRAICAPDADYTGPTVVRPLSFPKVQKKIEQVGLGYQKLMGKYARLHARMQQADEGVSAHFSDDEDSH
jgi:hypothetical protein